MSKVSISSIFASAALLLAAAGAQAAPVSSCALNMGTAGFTCSIYETNANGTPVEVSNVITLPNNVTGGFVIVLERPNGSMTNPNDWSDVLAFGNGSSDNTNQLRMWSDTGFTQDFINSVLNSTSKASVVEVQTGTGDDFIDFTTYNASPNTYRIFSGAPVNEGDVPEPASMALLGSGLVGLAVLARKRSKVV